MPALDSLAVIVPSLKGHKYFIGIFSNFLPVLAESYYYVLHAYAMQFPPYVDYCYFAFISSRFVVASSHFWTFALRTFAPTP